MSIVLAGARLSAGDDRDGASRSSRGRPMARSSPSNGKVVGSTIIGQLWTKPQYFQGRPSAAGKGYDPTATGGTNLGPTSKKLMDATRATIAQLKKDNPDARGHRRSIWSRRAAAASIPTSPPMPPIGRHRGSRRRATWTSHPCARSSARHVQGRTFGFLGEPHVNVLELNLALDGLARVVREGGGSRFAGSSIGFWGAGEDEQFARSRIEHSPRK